MNPDDKKKFINYIGHDGASRLELYYLARLNDINSKFIIEDEFIIKENMLKYKNEYEDYKSYMIGALGIPKIALSAPAPVAPPVPASVVALPPPQTTPPRTFGTFTRDLDL